MYEPQGSIVGPERARGTQLLVTNISLAGTQCMQFAS